MPSKFEVASWLKSAGAEWLLSPLLLQTVMICIVVLGASRLWRAVQRGAGWHDVLGVALAGAVIGDDLVYRFTYDSVSFVGAGLGLATGAWLCPSGPVRLFGWAVGAAGKTRVGETPAQSPVDVGKI